MKYRQNKKSTQKLSCLKGCLLYPNLQVMNSNTILLEENVPHNNDPEPLHYQYTDVGLIEQTTQPQKKTLYYYLIHRRKSCFISCFNLIEQCSESLPWVASCIRLTNTLPRKIVWYIFSIGRIHKTLYHFNLMNVRLCVGLIHLLSASLTPN